ncbi:MAG: hypothetical protein U5K74_04915 [Gemmatimonadaceae bacterium]|nr:hypothetical protein [Gemmatimonadaceae bacterium]
MHVLLTGARAPATLELARLCARAGHQVHVADMPRWHVCRGSRLLSGVHRLPAPRDGHGLFAAALERLVTRHRIDVIVPTCEEVFHLAAVAPLLSARVVCEPRDRLAALHDKWRFIAACADAALETPVTTLLRDGAATLRRLPAGRYALKPRFSRFATRVHVWSTGEPLPPVALSADWIAQEFLPGQALCTWSVATRGRITAHATYAVDATAGARGAAISFHSVRHAAILQWVRTFVAHHALSGQFAFDFIESERGLRAIECNPRLTSGVHCFRGMPAVADRLLRAHPDDDALLEPPEGRHFRSRLALLTYGRLRGHGAGLLDADDDPWPRRLQLLAWGHLLARAAWRRADPRTVSTMDIEWNGE